MQEKLRIVLRLQDVAYTLMLILEHFTRGVIDHEERNISRLQNLRCTTVTHFRCYKDTFLNRVMQLNDANNPHWKYKFIDDLPNFFLQNGLERPLGIKMRE